MIRKYAKQVSSECIYNFMLKSTYMFEQLCVCQYLWVWLLKIKFANKNYVQNLHMQLWATLANKS